MPSSKEINQQNESLNEQRDLMTEISELLSGAVESAEDLTDALGGVSDLFKQIGDEQKDEVKSKKQGNDQLSKTGRLLKGAQAQTKKLGGALKDAATTVANTLTSALGEIGDILSNVLTLSIAGTIGSVLGLALSKFQFGFKQVVDELGFGFQAVESNVAQNFEAMRGDIVEAGLEFKSVIGNALDLSNNFGMAVSEAQQFSFDIADGAKALGVQAKTMSTLVGQFQLLTDLSTQQSHELSEHIGILAAQNDVAPAAVLEDMAGSTEEMALFSKGGVKNFAKTAIEARKLGMSVKDVANSLKGMLNFEDSLNKEMQASVMLGKNINLNEARRLAFAGDTAGAFQAIADELGDVDLGALDPLTLQSVADAAGMSTEQLLKMSKGADEMGGVDMGEEAMTAQERAALKAENTMTRMEKALAKLSELGNKLADQFGDDIVGVLEDIVAFLTGDFSKIQEWGDAFKEWGKSLGDIDWVNLGKTIGAALLKGIKAAVVIGAKVLFGIGQAISESIIGGMLKIIGGLALVFPKQFTKMFAQITKTLRNFKATWLKTVVKPIKNATRPLRIFMKNLRGSKGFGMVTKLLKGVGKAFKLITTPIRMLLKPFKAVFSVAKGLFKPIAAVVKVFGRLGLRGIPILGQIITFIDGIFGGFKNVDTSLTGVTGAFKNMYRFITGFIFGAIEGIVTAFTGLFDYIFGTDLTAWFKDAFDFITEGFNTVTDGIVDFFADIPGNIAALFSNLGQLILDAISGAGDLAQAVIDWVGDAFSGLGEKIMGMVDIGTDFFSNLFTDALEGAKQIPGAIADVFVGLGTMISDKIKGAFNAIGDVFAGIGNSILNMFPDIDFGAIVGDMTKGVSAALSGIKDMFTWPINKIIDVINSVKNMISNRELYGGYTLLRKGALIGPDDWGYGVIGNLPPFSLKIPRIATPNLGADFKPLHKGGELKSDGLFEGKKGEVYAGAGDQAFKPISTKQEQTNQLLMEQNRLLMQILNQGIPVTKGT